MRTWKHRCSAFTLIELLIVVAIIAILALIAVPNFLEAQVRAKVSRVRTDMRSLATALEAYALDNNSDYPPYPEWGSHTNYEYLNALSTPIAYIASAGSINDPFRVPQRPYHDGQRHQRYGYFDPQSDPVAWAITAPDAYYNGVKLPGEFRWTLISLGPDHLQQTESEPPAGYFEYDPSNGTVSYGDIFRFGP